MVSENKNSQSKSLSDTEENKENEYLLLNHCNRLQKQTQGIAQEVAFIHEPLKFAQMGWAKSLYPDDQQRIFQDWNEAANEGRSFKPEYRFVHQDGEEVWLTCSANPEFNRNNQCMGYIGTLGNISEQKLNEQSKRLMATVFEHCRDGMVVTDKHFDVISVNPAFEQITGYPSREVIGKQPHFFYSERQDNAFFNNLWKKIKQQGFWQGELWNRRKDGGFFPQWMNISAVPGKSNEVLNYVIVFSDISKIKQSEQKLAWLAYHDPLTDLANRTLFAERLLHNISRAKRDESNIAVVFLDLDKFKHINDSLGHKTGDELLVAVANRLQGLVRKNDTLSRLGGDEFSLLIDNYCSLSDLNRIISKILDSFKRSFSTGRQTLYMSTSIGISIYPNDGEDVDTLLKNADSAMYKAKQEGGDCFSFYTRELTEQAHRRMQVETGIRQALKNDELYLLYQPQFNGIDGSLIGAEALLRWESETLGTVMPAHFIPIIEQSSLVHKLGLWVLEHACQQARQWQQYFGENFRMGVNLSARQLQKNGFVDELMDILKRNQLPTRMLDLEVTEGVIMSQFECKQLARIRALGMSISIDDFGTGYSSLSYLSQLPVDRLKIDQSFVQDIGCNQKHEAIVRAMIEMGHAHGLEIVAEGVEQSQQFDFLQAEGCDELQGFLMGKPMSAEHFERQLNH